MPNKLYDILKWVAIIALPAIGVCIEGIFNVWGIPYGHEIEETLKYLSVCLGALLGVSNILYKKNLEKEETNESE